MGVAVVEDPQIAQYTPRASLGELREAFETRWVHGLNTQSPWNFVRNMISQDYSQFLPIPWFIGEFGGNGQDEDVIQADMESMQAQALGSDAFLGAAFFQFQTTYWKGGAEMNFGLFGLGEEQIGETGEVCQGVEACHTWPVHCLTTNLSWLPGAQAHRAQAVALAWGGSINHASLCSDERRLDAALVGTKLACQIRSGAGSETVGAVAAALGTAAFSKRITHRTQMLLEAGSDALRGELTLKNSGTWGVEDASGGQDPNKQLSPSWILWAVAGIVAVLLVGAVCIVVGRRGKPQRSVAESSAGQVV